MSKKKQFSVDIIPIIDVEKDDKNMNSNKNVIEPSKVMPNIKYCSAPYDPHLINRVKEYLAIHSEQRQVDIVEMADYLQSKYREYMRRKRKAFQAYVKNAYELLLDEYKRQHVTTCWSDAEDDDDDDEDEDDVVENDPDEISNPLNDGLNKLYQQKLLEHSEPINITISSDEDEDVNEGKDKNCEPSKTVSSSLNSKQRFIAAMPIKDNIDSRKRKYPSYNAIAAHTPSKRKRDVSVIESRLTFESVGGIDNILNNISRLLTHIKRPELYRHMGVTPPRGFLLHGPPGCGKTLLANAIAGELCVPLLKVAAPELVAGVSGESEERIRSLFEQAAEIAPCVLFIDEIDVITPYRQQAQREMERRIVAQLLSCLDELSAHENGDQVLVIGATNRPDSIDSALRRAGRFDREIAMGIPDAKARLNILRVLCKNLKLEPNFNYESLASLTPGFVGADLLSLVREASIAAVDRVLQMAKQETIQLSKETNTACNTIENGVEKPDSVSSPKENSNENQKTDNPVVDNETVNETEKNVDEEQKEELVEEKTSLFHDSIILTEEQMKAVQMTYSDFQIALKNVQPSAKREGFATVPDVTWDDVGSLKEIRSELQLAILAPVRHTEQIKQLGLNTPTGVLLIGPPGCGKTLLAKAVANEAGINFISVKGPELLNMYVGESERAVRLCFQRARNSAPCVIFFDELDALCPKRSDSSESGAAMRVVNQMLTEMDGVEGREGVYLMAASNRPDIIDPAVLRPGRFDKILYVGIPSARDRVDILRVITKNGTKPKLASDVDLSIIGESEQCTGYTGADLAALVREASILALREYLNNPTENANILVTTQHFVQAIRKIRPSVSDKDKIHYEKLRKLYSVVQDDDEIEDVQMADA